MVDLEDGNIELFNLFIKHYTPRIMVVTSNLLLFCTSMDCTECIILDECTNNKCSPVVSKKYYNEMSKNYPEWKI